MKFKEVWVLGRGTHESNRFRFWVDDPHGEVFQKLFCDTASEDREVIWGRACREDMPAAGWGVNWDEDTTYELE